MPTSKQLDVAVARARQQRETWKPTPLAWDQLIQLQGFVGKRVRIQFWCDGTMWLLDEDEWPDKVEADCEGAVTLLVDGFLQAFLVLRDPVGASPGKRSESRFLADHRAINCKLAPLADIYEIEFAREAR